ncbi:MAG: domain protein beta Propeller, partial [Actinomycetia bacterium]|nr:domain protein beta Propeller [Actinomycetes bacterium]
MRRMALVGTGVLAIAGLGAGALAVLPGLTSAGAATAPPLAPLQAPAVVSTSAGSLDAFSRDRLTRAITQQSFTAGGWGNPSSLGGGWSTGPGAAADPGGRVMLAAAGTNNKVSIRIRTNGSWGAWAAVDGSVSTTAQPAVASTGKDSFALVVRGTDNHAWIRFWTSGTWAAWRSLGATLSTAPAAAGLPNHSVAVVAAGSGGVLWTTTATLAAARQAPTWTSVGGKTTQTPALAVDPVNGEQEIFATDPAGAMTQRQHRADGVWEWKTFASGASTGLAVATSGHGQADALAYAGGKLSQASMRRNYTPGVAVGYTWTRFQAVHSAQSGPGVTTRVSGPANGDEANGDVIDPVLSADGRYTAFTSFATNVVPGDTNAAADIFRRDLRTGAVIRISVSTAGKEGNNSSTEPSISADGRYVSFVSPGDLGDPGDQDAYHDVYVRDTVAGTTTRVSLTPDGKSPNGDSEHATISADGNVVTFVSRASNLVAGDTNGKADLFVRNLTTGRTSLVDVAADGTQADRGATGGTFDKPRLSADGRYVSFSTDATNLVPGDTNGKTDVFVRDTEAGTTTLVSAGLAGAPGDGSSNAQTMSADGRLVAFQSLATNLVEGDTNHTFDVFVRDVVAGTTSRVSLGAGGTQLNRPSFQGSLAADGKVIAFVTDDPAVVAGDTNGHADGFVRALGTGEIRRFTTTAAGEQSEGAPESMDPLEPALSADGTRIIWASTASDLVPRDLNA